MTFYTGESILLPGCIGFYGLSPGVLVVPDEPRDLRGPSRARDLDESTAAAVRSRPRLERCVPHSEVHVFLPLCLQYFANNSTASRFLYHLLPTYFCPNRADGECRARDFAGTRCCLAFSRTSAVCHDGCGISRRLECGISAAAGQAWESDISSPRLLALALVKRRRA